VSPSGIKATLEWMSAGLASPGTCSKTALAQSRAREIITVQGVGHLLHVFDFHRTVDKAVAVLEGLRGWSR